MKIRFAVLFLVALPLFAADEMRKLDWMAGEWSGEASVRMGPQPAESVLQHERVQTKLGGKVLFVEGLGKRKLADGTAGEVVHEAVGVMSWDEKAKKYNFDAWTAKDGYVKAWMEVSAEGNVRWGFDPPNGGTVRYTISRTEKGQWHEVGEYVRDGRTMKFFEMTLQKSK